MEKLSEQHEKNPALRKNGKRCSSAKLHQNIVMANKGFPDHKDIDKFVNLNAICYALQLENQQLKTIIYGLYHKIRPDQPIDSDIDGSQDGEENLGDEDSDRLIIDESSLASVTDIEEPSKDISVEISNISLIKQ